MFENFECFACVYVLQLARRPQLVMALDDIALRLGDAVLVACSDQRTRTASTTRAAVLRGDEHAVSDAQRDADSALIADVDLLTTAAPLLAMLGTARPSRWLASSLALLVRAAHCTGR